MMHFYINEENNTVEILAVISTDRNPKIWKEKSSKHLSIKKPGTLSGFCCFYDKAFPIITGRINNNIEVKK